MNRVVAFITYKDRHRPRLDRGTRRIAPPCRLTVFRTRDPTVSRPFLLLHKSNRQGSQVQPRPASKWIPDLRGLSGVTEQGNLSESALQRRRRMGRLIVEPRQRSQHGRRAADLFVFSRPQCGDSFDQTGFPHLAVALAKRAAAIAVRANRVAKPDSPPMPRYVVAYKR